MRKIPPKEYSQQQFMLILEEVDRRFNDLERSINAAPFVVTGATGRRQIDVDTATPQEVADFVATLVADLRRAGRLF